MLAFIVRRLLWSIPFLFAISLIAFAIIQAPPGDFATTLAAKLAESGEAIDGERLQAIRDRYGLNDPFLVQYWKWISGVLQGDFGISFAWQQPVSELIGERMALSVCLAVATMLFTWAVALPIGIYSAIRKYSIGDYFITAVGFIGLAMPNFLFALVLMYIGVVYFGANVSGLFSPEFENAAWSMAKVVDLLAHLWIPVLILGTSTTASISRIMRANLLDELHKPYVTTARAKGMSEWRLLLKYPVRVALNPFVSTIGWAFPQIISGSTITAVVLSLPTADPLMLQSLMTQDMYLAGAFILLLCTLSVVGMLVSDILLAIVDPPDKVPVMSTTPIGVDPRLAGSDTSQVSGARLVWRAFRRHRLAMAGAIIVALLYVISIFVEFIAPFDPNEASSQSAFHPPQGLHFIDRQADGDWSIRPYVFGTKSVRDQVTLKVTTTLDPDTKIYLNFFGVGEEYRLWGLIPANRHLLVPEDPNQKFYLFGADRLGRDLFSRTIHGTRVSMSIGLAGVTISLVLGLILGGIAGYRGGWWDAGVQRVTELIMSLPTIPIWLGLSAAIPADWSPITRYFAITLILSLVGWTELARVVRGRFLAMKGEDFVVSARLDGVKERRIIFRHMMPSMVSHIIASVSLAIPAMILAETALSFLGLGLRPPTVSWGVLLQEAQNVRSIAQAPWLFIPGAAVCLAVLSLNFLGDGLRDAADPYANGGR